MKKVKLTAVTLLIAAIFFTSCDNDDDNKPAPTNEEELITTVQVTLTSGAQVVTLTSKDLDGDDGPNPPQVSVSGNLTANTTYTGEVAFLNELKNPVEDITEEVEEEGPDHQVFYQANASLGSFKYADSDTNGQPVGVAFSYKTENATTGNITVTLRHMLNKSAAGVANGDITNAGGSTDAEVIFPVTIK
jgi:hypothetical protein